MAASPRSRRLVSKPLAVVLLSLALHGLVLTPLAMDLFRSSAQRPALQYRTPIYVDILPRPLRSADLESATPTPQPVSAPFGRSPQTADETDARMGNGLSQSLGDTGSPARQAPVADPPWQVRPDDPDQDIADALRRGAAGCRVVPGRLDPMEQARCDQRFGDAAARAVAISGTGDRNRDARFAAEGAQALADYERRRAPLKPNSRAQPCPHGTDIMGGCPVRVMVPLWSSTDGFLPSLKRDD